jgi:hypothetical protein
MSYTLNLNMPNVKEQSLTVDEIRAAMDNEDMQVLIALHEKIEQWLDEAQGDVYSNKHDKVYLVIEVTK